MQNQNEHNTIQTIAANDTRKYPFVEGALILPDPNDDVYELWTIQNENVLKELEENGQYSVADDRIMFQEDDNYFCHQAYLWLCEQMKQKIGMPLEGVHYPVWCWYKDQGRTTGKPDMRFSGHAKRGEHVVRLKLSVPSDKVLLSDFDDWHFALNCWYLPETPLDDEDFDERLRDAGFEFFELSNPDNHDETLMKFREEAKSSWDRMFLINSEGDDEWSWDWKNKTIQATLWELRSEYIQSVEHFIAR